jgi:hypothetical protein
MAQQLEARVAEKMRNVALVTGEEIVDTQHFMTIGDKPIAQMGPEETCTACHQDSFFGSEQKLPQLMSASARVAVV